MPYHLEQSGAGYYVVGPSGRHSKRPMPRRRAVQQMRALYAAEKDAGTTAGAMLAGPGGLLATPGMGTRKWGNRSRHKDCTCGVATKGEQIAPGITRIRGNLCNVHGRYGLCPGATRKPKGGKGRKPKALAKPKQTPEQRASERDAEQQQNRAQVFKQLGLFEDATAALDDLRAGKAVADDGGLVKMGLAEQSADGSYRLTPAGRALVAAANSGDAGRARDVMSAARDRKDARTAREQAAAQRKLDAANKRAEAEAKRAEREAERKKRAEERAKKGGGSKQGQSSAGEARAVERQQREAERQAGRAQRQREHEEDRARSLREHEEDRARREEERQQDRAARLEERRQMLAERRRAPERISRARTPIVYGRRRAKAADGFAHWDGTSWTTKAETYGGVKRSNLDDSVFAGPDRSFPIKTAQDVRDAVRSLGRTKHDKAAVKRGIIRRARAIGAMDALPDSWREKSFAVFKDASGAYRWIARTTTAYRDRDGEIITTTALEADAQRMTATKQYGPLRYWHLGHPDPFDPATPWGPGVDIGDCDYSVVIGRTSIESGTFKSAAIGKAFAENADDYELSPGFFHPPAQPNAAGEYDAIRRFERSVVPVKYGRASNLFTGLTVKEHRMDDATYKARVNAYLTDMREKGVPPEVAAQQLASMEQADKSAEAQGIAFKSDDAPAPEPVDPWAAVVTALKAALQPTAPAAEPEQVETKDDGEGDMEVMAEEGAVEEAPMEVEGGGEYIGDMTPAEFWAQLRQYLTELLAPQSKMEEMAKAFAAGLGEMKALYATKDAGATARLTAIEQAVARLVGDQPAVVAQADVEAALKGAPQAPPEPNAIEVPDDPDRPLAPLTARLMPSLYGGAVQGYQNGWQIGQPVPPPNTGGN